MHIQQAFNAKTTYTCVCEFTCMHVYVLGTEGDLSHICLQRGPVGVMKRSCLALYHNGMSIGSKLP